MIKYSILLVVLFSQQSLANYYCTGKVDYLGSTSGGVLAAGNGYGVHYLCNVSEESCKTWVSFITAAKMADRNIRFYYNNPSKSGENGENCSTVGSWVWPDDSVYHVELR